MSVFVESIRYKEANISAAVARGFPIASYVLLLQKAGVPLHQVAECSKWVENHSGFFYSEATFSSIVVSFDDKATLATFKMCWC